MVWLGGLSVGLAGIFMVSHSMNAGLIGPVQQLVMALVSGLALHAGAEYLRRRNQGADQVFAALAGGGSVAFVLAYSFLITLSSLLLMRYVYRDWLWYATLAGALLWWLVTVSSAAVGIATAWYIAGLFLLFAILPGSAKAAAPRLREVLISLLVVWAWSMVDQPVSGPLAGLQGSQWRRHAIPDTDASGATGRLPFLSRCCSHSHSWFGVVALGASE